jgi:cyclic-di-GMP-binding protein
MPSFDVVSTVVDNEVDNALLQAQKEIGQRFDFKDTGTEIEKTQEGIVLRSDTENRLDAALKVLQEKLVKRGVSLKSLDPQKPEPGARGSFRQLVKLKQGIATEKGKEIVKYIKDTKLKVQASIQGDQLRITGKKKDDLQEAIAVMKAKDFDLPLQFTNFRD